MTEISTNNDFNINNKPHQSQPLRNSPRHLANHSNTPYHQNQHLSNYHQHFNHTHAHNNINNLQAHLTLKNATPANLNHNNTAASSPTHSPRHYKNPFNSPSNTPSGHAYYGGGVPPATTATAATNKRTKASTTASHSQHHQLQQHLRGRKLSSHLTQTQYQQHLNDLLLQQQHLQQQQQQLLNEAKDSDDELSEESLKQNVAIVLNNLDRYNNALRSIILNEQVSNYSSVFIDDTLLLSNGNDNYNHNNGNTNNNTMAAPATPESDYNSNATTPGSRNNMLPHDGNMLPQQHLVGPGIGSGGGVGNNCGTGGGVGFCNVGGNNVNCSLASSHDFTHDNSDYQWFLDYGYRDGCGGMQRSVLSSLSASYNGIGDLIYYEDLAKNLDANLAEVDMESFRAEDIHSLLSQLPSYCKSLGGNKLQQSLQHMLPALAHHGHNISQTSTTSTNELIDNSICKSELLFSPVKESAISIDSLDMDAYPEDGDIILTCKANKDNYTIAFEGSVLYSDESFYEPNEIAMKNKQNFINLHNNLEDLQKRQSLDVSMCSSEQALMTRSRLQKTNHVQLQRYPSGNNNTPDTPAPLRHAAPCTLRKSSSLPNLGEGEDGGEGDEAQQQHEEQQMAEEEVLPPLNVSQALNTSAVDSCKARNLLPMCQMPISCSSNSDSTSERLPMQCQKPNAHHHHHHHHHQQLQQHHHHHCNQQQLQEQTLRQKHRCSCSSSSSGGASTAASTLQQKHSHISGSASSGNSNPPAFNLVKLYIKQKSSNCSTEDQVSSHTCMDVSSGCWPSSDAAGSSSSSSLEQRLRKKSMNDSGKGSALSRHDEEELLQGGDHSASRKHLRGVFYDEEQSSSSAGSLTATNSPAHRRRSVPLRHPQLCQLAAQHNSGTSAGSSNYSDPSRSNSEQLTQVHLASAAGGQERRKSRTASAAASTSEMITRSMQTSCGSLSTRSSFSERLRCVPPSFLAKLNNLGQERQAPIYVIYPNYALPDLGFVKTQPSADVIFSPFNYKTAVGSGSTSSLKKRLSLGDTEDEILQTIDYQHVKDWESLATLLPSEYRRRLKHIPQVNAMLAKLDSESSQRPLFCMSPPIRRNRPHICDCAQYFQQKRPGEEATSSSGSSQQPSSGYRGSSTLLTDSELDTADPLKQMYVYQYDQQQRMDSGVESSPAVRTPPQPLPRGILRKTGTTAARSKRNSMIEAQQTKISKLEKRRSLQEPPHNYGGGSMDELYEVCEEEGEFTPAPCRQERLSRKDLDARARAENFLSSLPRSELKYYAEIAAILESSEQQVQYDSAALKKEVSRALSQQKKVSFNDMEAQQVLQQQLLQADKRQSRFTTPPNSPNISMAAGGGGTANGLRMQSGHTVPRRGMQTEKPTTLDEREKRKIESNRFKRLQIQWELMSKDSSMLKDLASAQQTKSGGSTPTSATSHKSRIPRPVSYPAGNPAQCKKVVAPPLPPKDTKMSPLSSPRVSRITAQDASGKGAARSPSRIVPPKRYSIAGSPAATTGRTTATKSPTTPTTPASRARTPTSRTPATAPNTPKRRVQSPKTVPRVR